MARRSTLAFVAWTACALAPAHSSAWTRATGKIFVASKIEYFSSDLGAQSTFHRLDSSTYAEFGLLDRTAVGAKVGYGTSWTTDATGGAVGSGFSEIEGFAQRELWRGRRDVGSVRLGVIAPPRNSAGARGGVASDGVSVEARALYGRTLALRPFKVFANVETAFRKSFGDGADEIRADLTIGAEPSDRFLILIDAFTTTSLKNEKVGGADYDVYKAQASVVWRAARRWRIQAGYNRELAGRNVALGDSFILGLWSEF